MFILNQNVKEHFVAFNPVKKILRLLQSGASVLLPPMTHPSEAHQKIQSITVLFRVFFLSVSLF